MAKKYLALLAAACLCLALSACGQGEQGGLNPGAYVGIGTGHGGPIEVELTIDSAGSIANIIILNANESPDYFSAAQFELFLESVIMRQSLGLDAVAGATLSSQGLLAAAADAIAKAGGDPKDFGFVSAGERAEVTDILFTGLPGGDFTLTGGQLKRDYELSEADAVSINSKGTEKQVRAKGVLLETILQAQGASVMDFDAVTATASDGYTITIPSEVLHGRDILIAFEANGEEIDPRFVVPGERAMYWVKLLSEIAFEKAAEEMPVTQEIALSELLDQLQGFVEDYHYHDADCRAIPISWLMAGLGVQRADFVTIKSIDGLTKTEKYDLFAAQLLVIEGTPEAPLYTGPDLPAGMRLKNVASIQVGGTLVKM